MNIPNPSGVGPIGFITIISVGPGILGIIVAHFIGYPSVGHYIALCGFLGFALTIIVGCIHETIMDLRRGG